MTVQTGAPPTHMTSGGSGIGARLTQKLGPLPVWAWGGIGAVGVFLLMRRKGGTPANGSTVSDNSNGAGSSGGGDGSGSAGSGTTTVAPPVLPIPNSTVQVTPPPAKPIVTVPVPKPTSTITKIFPIALLKGFIGTPATATAQINAARLNPVDRPVTGPNGTPLTPDLVSFFDRMQALGVVKATPTTVAHDAMVITPVDRNRIQGGYLI